MMRFQRAGKEPGLDLIRLHGGLPLITVIG